MAKASTSTEDVVRLQPIERAVVEVFIEGISPLIIHKWSEKALGLMRDKQFGKSVRAKHEPKDPLEEAEASLYRLEDGAIGMPATAFKAAAVGAARMFQGITMVALKTAVFVLGEGTDQLVRIDGEKTLREDTPRNANGVVDLRYRYAIYPWSATLRVQFLPTMIDPTSVVALFDAAGNGGVGDWRPSSPKSSTGTFGRFQVSS